MIIDASESIEVYDSIEELCKPKSEIVKFLNRIISDNGNFVSKEYATELKKGLEKEKQDLSDAIENLGYDARNFEERAGIKDY